MLSLVTIKGNVKLIAGSEQGVRNHKYGIIIDESRKQEGGHIMGLLKLLGQDNFLGGAKNNHYKLDIIIISTEDNIYDKNMQQALVKGMKETIILYLDPKTE